MSTERNQGGYPEHLAPNAITAAHVVDLACRKLMAPGTRLNDPAHFDHRVKADAIRSWRHGRNGVPRWALDLLASKLAAHGARYLELEALARSIPASPGTTSAAGKQALNRYRAAQAAKKNSPSG